jgi:hypothetical protein
MRILRRRVGRTKPRAPSTRAASPIPRRKRSIKPSARAPPSRTRSPGSPQARPITSSSASLNWWTAPGQRVFNVGINGATVLGNFDIFKTAGARLKAVAESFSATASSGGTITIGLTAVTNYAAIDAIEIAAAGGATPTPTPPPTSPPASGSVAINSGGTAAGSFAADGDFALSSWTYKTTGTIETSGVTNPAPQSVYQDEREGATVTYTIPGLTPGAAYALKLSFAELWLAGPGQRVFNIGINGATVLSNFDIFKAAGTRLKAVAESFNAMATSTGTIAIKLTAVTNTRQSARSRLPPGAVLRRRPRPPPQPHRRRRRSSIGRRTATTTRAAALIRIARRSHPQRCRNCTSRGKRPAKDRKRNRSSGRTLRVIKRF